MQSAEDLKASLNIGFPLKKNPILNHNDSFFMIGSCFSQEISTKLRMLGIASYCSEFGTLFTPQSIEKTMKVIASKADPFIHFFDGIYHAMDFPLKFKDTDPENLSSTIIEVANKNARQLEKADHIFITLGTAWYYTIEKQPVGNCHKIPQSFFNKQIAGTKETQASLQSILSEIQLINPKANVYFTISPVRHLRDGLEENNRSKSILKAALSEFIDANPTVGYFPAFEIVSEELKDHRFYKADLMHPGDFAIDYVFTRLIETLGAESLWRFTDEAQKLLRKMSHQPRTEVEQIAWKEKLNPQIAQFQNEWGTTPDLEEALQKSLPHAY
jgi:hypothetical protein